MNGKWLAAAMGLPLILGISAGGITVFAEDATI